jgi:hypothetical protein
MYWLMIHWIWFDIHRQMSYKNMIFTGEYHIIFNVSLVNNCIVLYYIKLYCIILYQIKLYCIILYQIKLYCIILYHIKLYCITPYQIVLYCILPFGIIHIFSNRWPTRILSMFFISSVSENMRLTSVKFSSLSRPDPNSSSASADSVQSR